MFGELPAGLRRALLAMKLGERPVAGQRRSTHYLGFAHRALRRWQTGDPNNGSWDPDFFMDLLRSYSPPRLPIAVDLFGPERTMKRLRRLWRHYATAGVRCHSMFEEHTDMFRPDLMAHLAAELETALAVVEATNTHGAERQKESLRT
jgi:hypothetical protein